MPQTGARGIDPEHADGGRNVFNKEWEVLLVDDDPDVLTVSRLAMRSFTVYGIPLKIHTCTSKAEAIELLNTKHELMPTLAVAFIDVVMETDEAGLELCQYIREERKNRVVQLFVRTGQPGIAPERAVIDRYDINGYFSKLETTEDKLYSLTKSGVRQYYWTVTATSYLALTRYLATTVGSRAALAALIQQVLDGAFVERDGSPNETLADPRIGVIFGDEVVGSVGLDRDSALSMRDRLNEEPGVRLSPAGDKYFVDDQHMFIKVAAQPDVSPAYVVAQTRFRQPEFYVETTYNSLALEAALWSKAT
jgi:CheY-like chemotaxis protein